VELVGVPLCPTDLATPELLVLVDGEVVVDPGAAVGLAERALPGVLGSWVGCCSPMSVLGCVLLDDIEDAVTVTGIIRFGLGIGRGRHLVSSASRRPSL
jgi:hypothetical protein